MKITSTLRLLVKIIVVTNTLRLLVKMTISRSVASSALDRVSSSCVRLTRCINHTILESQILRKIVKVLFAMQQVDDFAVELTFLTI